MNIDRVLVLKAAMAGQVPMGMVTPEEVVELELNVMDAILERKYFEGKMAFRVDSKPRNLYN